MKTRGTSEVDRQADIDHFLRMGNYDPVYTSEQPLSGFPAAEEFSDYDGRRSWRPEARGTLRL